MKKEFFELHADFCRTFSNAKRLELLDLLKSGEMTVTELQNKMGITKANASQQLMLMRMKRIAKARREGANVFYSIASKQIAEACGLVQEALAQAMGEEQETKIRRSRR
jgi:ArsR family transcriptional regulator